MELSVVFDLRELDRILRKPNLSSSETNLLDEFYVPLLDRSTIYKRAAGFFTSGLIALRPLAFANFVERAGTIQLICSPRLQASDVEALTTKASGELVTRETVVSELRAIYESNGAYQLLVRALSSMIHANVLNIRVLVPVREASRYMFHDKLGLFSDGENWVTFVGSGNETPPAWLPDGNHEYLTVFKSWDDRDRERIERHRYDFDRLWAGARGWRVIRQSSFEADLFEIAPPIDFHDSLDQIRYQASPTRSTSFQTTPEPKELRGYQNQVLQNWDLAGRRGIVAFATGGGKTLVAIEAIRRWQRNGRPALVLVPTAILHDQWMREIETEMPGSTVTPAGAGYPVKGREQLLRASLDKSIVVATFATAASSRFQKLLGEDTSQLLVVADEVHNAGQPSFERFLSTVRTGAALGLSATPERYGDPDGTGRIERFFGPVLQPTFTLAGAIEDGVLVPYEYDYRTATLNDQEQEEWDELTTSIRNQIGRNKSDDGPISEILKRLLIKRSRILKKAQEKIRITSDIVQEFLEPNDRWLIYCADQSQLSEVKASLQDLKIGQILEYHQNMRGSRSGTIDYFGSRTGVLLAIKCLDEGVNIPAVNKAVILASSTNPREYIQRRGRLLRRSSGKSRAHIWDCMVRNQDGRIISEGELIRGMEFAETSQSPDTLLYLRQEARESGYEHLNFEDETEDESEGDRE
jgi:superfamily II DNA or RNA helicase